MAAGMLVIFQSIRDHFNIMAKKWRVKVRQEERKSGGGDEKMSAVKKVVEELVELEMESERSRRKRQITERGEKEGRGDEEKRHGDVKQDQKEPRRHRKR